MAGFENVPPVSDTVDNADYLVYCETHKWSGPEVCPYCELTQLRDDLTKSQEEVRVNTLAMGNYLEQAAEQRVLRKQAEARVKDLMDSDALTVAYMDGFHKGKKSKEVRVKELETLLPLLIHNNVDNIILASIIVAKATQVDIEDSKGE